MNSRFVVGLIENIEIKPSPDLVQHRLNLIEQRPINNIVDATNYVMFDLGQPLHAFDYDELVRRAGGKAPTLITRAAKPGEKLTTLDGEERELEDFTTLICDTKGTLVWPASWAAWIPKSPRRPPACCWKAANWNLINIRQSLSYLKMHSEASYRFARGVHPAMAERGVRMGLELMRQWSGGVIAKGLVDDYPTQGRGGHRRSHQRRRAPLAGDRPSVEQRSANCSPAWSSTARWTATLCRSPCPTTAWISNPIRSTARPI